MPKLDFLGAHRQAYLVARETIISGGQYMVNDEIAAKKEGKLNIRVAQSMLWSQIPLSTGSTNYLMNLKFGVPNAGNSGVLPGEVRLKDQDVFFTYAFGFYIMCYTSPTAGAAFQNKLMTFPSSDFFGPAPVLIPGLFTYVGLWNYGRMSIKVNGEITTPVWDLSQHLHIPETQVASPWNGNPAQDELDMGIDGLVVVEPNWIINGANNNEYNIGYPANYSNILLSTDYTFHIVAKWMGFLAQNVSSIMNNAPLK